MLGFQKGKWNRNKTITKGNSIDRGRREEGRGGGGGGSVEFQLSNTFNDDYDYTHLCCKPYRSYEQKRSEDYYRNHFTVTSNNYYYKANMLPGSFCIRAINCTTVGILIIIIIIPTIIAPKHSLS